MNGEKVPTDERILETDDFVEGMLGEADRRARRSFPSRLQDKAVQQLIEEKCKIEGISLQALQMESRHGAIPGFDRI